MLKLPSSAPLVLSALGLLFAPIAALAIPEPDDPPGPPAFSINGCPHAREWTDEVVADALGVAKRTVERLHARHGLSSLAICTTPYADIRGRIENSKFAKHRYDQPDEAARYRDLARRSDDGTIKADGFYRATLQREDIVAKTRLKAGGITSLSWSNIGPPAAGGRVRAILAPHAAATPATRMLVGSVSGGIWKTEDAGATWAPVNDFMMNVAIACLVRDPLVPNTIYACTGEIFAGDGVRGFGVWKSVDNGSNWSLVASTNPTSAPVGGTDWYYVNRLAIQPGNSSVLLAATGGGVYRSADAGSTWTRVLGDIPATLARRSLGDVKFHPLDGNRVLAGEMSYFDGTTVVGGGVWFSNDAGLTFTRIALGGTSRVEVQPVAGVAGRWLAVPNVNSGELWQLIEQPNPTAWTSTKLSTPAHLGAQGSYGNLLWVSSDGVRIIVGGVPMKFSADSGATWSASLNGIHVDHHVAITDAAAATVYFGNDGGVYKSTNALTATAVATPAFSAINTGLVITQFYGGAGKASASQRITGGTQDNGSWTFDGTNWARTFGSDGGNGDVDSLDPNYVYGEVQNLAIFRSTDGGGSANYICYGITDSDCAFSNPSPKTNFIAPFRIDQLNPVRMLAGGESLWRSDNVKSSAPTWTAIKGPQLNQAATGNTLVYSIAIAPGNSDLVYVGYNDGQLWRLTNATAPTPTWTRVTFTGITNPQRALRAILIDPQDPNIVYVTLGGYNTGNVVKTTNAGGNWTNLHPSAIQLPATPVRAIARHPAVPSILYVGTEIGVFVSEDSGGTWNATNDGPGTVSIEELFFMDSSTLIAATHGRGFFRATVNFIGSPGTIQLERATNYVIAGNNAVLNATRLGGGTGAASASYSTTGGTATLGSDFTAASGPLNWSAGDVAMKPITIAVAANSATEGYETFGVNLSAITGALAGDPTSATVGILSPFVPTNAVPAGFTTPAGTGAWTAASDSVYEGGFSLKGDISAIVAATKAVEYTGLFGPGTIAFGVRPSTYSAHPVRFSIDGNEMGAWSGDGGWAVVAFPITAGAHTLRWSIARVFSNVLGQNAGWIDAVTLPLQPANTVAFAEASTLASEAIAGGVVTLRVVRSAGSSGNASVNWATANGTATAGSDYTASSGTVSFTGVEVEKTITIPVANDGAAEGAETFTVSLSAASGATLGQPLVATVILSDPFPGAGIPPGYTTSAGANAGWSVATDSFFDPPNSLKSNPIADSQRADVETTVTTGAGIMSFARRVSSEPGFDFLWFYVDGLPMASWSGEVAWSVVSFPVNAGVHTFRWSYQKDSTAASGSDAAWIDMVAFPAVAAPTFALTVSKSGAGSGTVTSSPAGIDCGSSCAFSFASGTMVTLTPTPLAGSTFAGWSGDCSGTGGCTVTLSAARNVGAAFSTVAPSTFALGVSKTGTGSGTVSSSPAGIDCGATCSANFSSGAVVALTATPVAGSIFGGWSGDCSGTGGCSVTLSAARNVGAAFALQPAGTLSASPATLAFGAQSMNTTSPSLSTTITNPTGVPVTVTGITLSAGYAASHNCATLAAAATCQATVTFTPPVTGSTGPVNGTLTIAYSGGPTTVTLTGTGEKSLVTHYYRSILRRAPDAGGKTYWEGEATRVSGLGASINETWFAMAQAFYFSGEYAAFNRNNNGYATDLYNTFFNRAPDAGGLSFWVGQLDSGLPREVALAAFMFSTEFANFTTAIFGNVTSRAEVNAVVDFYRGLLARTPDDGGFNFWVGRFRTAQCQNAAAVTAQVEAISSAYTLSTEYLARARTNAQYVGDLYNAFLRRGGDLGGVNFWIAQIALGTQTREQVRVQFRNSTEFQARVAAIIAQGCL